MRGSYISNEQWDRVLNYKLISNNHTGNNQISTISTPETSESLHGFIYYSTLMNGDKVYSTSTSGGYTIDTYGANRGVCNLFDSYTSNNWSYGFHSFNGNTETTVMYEFIAGAQLVSAMQFFQPHVNHGASDVKIWYSTDATTFTEIAAFDGYANIDGMAFGEGRVLKFQTAVNAKYIKFEISRTINEYNNYVGLMEVQILAEYTEDELDMRYDTQHPNLSIRLSNHHPQNQSSGSADDRKTFVDTYSGLVYYNELQNGDQVYCSDRLTYNISRLFNTYKTSNYTYSEYGWYSGQRTQYHYDNGEQTDDTVYILYKFQTAVKVSSVMFKQGGSIGARNLVMSYGNNGELDTFTPIVLDNDLENMSYNEERRVTFTEVTTQLIKIKLNPHPNRMAYIGLYEIEIYGRPIITYSDNTDSDSVDTLPPPELVTTLTMTSGNWEGVIYSYKHTIGNLYVYGHPDYEEDKYYFAYNYVSGEYEDVGNDHPANIIRNGDQIKLHYHGNPTQILAVFTDPYNTVGESVSIDTTPLPEIVTTLTMTSGNWGGVTYLYKHTTGRLYVYGHSGYINDDQYEFAYNYVTSEYEDVGNSHPANIISRYGNQITLYYDGNPSQTLAVFTDPYQ